MQVEAKLRHLRISPRKVRRVADLIRNYNAEEAKIYLEHLPQRGVRPILKLIDSALSNAKHNFGLDTSNLYIKKLTVDGGPVLKRFRPRAFGRAAPIAKRTSHLTLILDEGKASSMALPERAFKPSKVEEPLKSGHVEKVGKSKKPTLKEKIPLKQRLYRATRRIFQRKAIG